MYRLCIGFGIAPYWKKIGKNDNDVTVWWHDVIVKYFYCCFVYLLKFSSWSKFHVNIITGSGVMTIYFCKGLAGYPAMVNTPTWVLLNIWGLEQVRDTKFVIDVSNKILLNAAKCQGHSFYQFWVIEGKPTWGVKVCL